VLLGALSTGNKIGLAVVAVVFIAFALTASFLAPRRRPDFPGRNGLSVFVIASIVLFAGMLTAVAVFGRESEEEASAAVGEGGAGGAAGGQTIQVKESEYRIQLPTLETLKGGEYTFEVENTGQIPHNLVIEGPNVTGQSTSLIQPGETLQLKVALETGTYTLYCSVDSHRAQGMSAKISVG
jgi:uncharacterized cupredoxin-like copper-binding protein